MANGSLLKALYSRNILWNGLYREQKTLWLFCIILGYLCRPPPVFFFFNLYPDFQCPNVRTFITGSGSCECFLPLKVPRAPGMLGMELR